MLKNGVRSSKKTAKVVSKLLRSNDTEKKVKKVAASALVNRKRKSK